MQGKTLADPRPVESVDQQLNHNGEIEDMYGGATGIDESRLGLFYWDGFNWRLVGCSGNCDNNTVSGKIKHFSLYAIFPVGPLSADDYRPKRNIITPATVDTYNDTADFDNLTDEFEIDIWFFRSKIIVFRERTSD